MYVNLHGISMSESVKMSTNMPMFDSVLLDTTWEKEEGGGQNEYVKCAEPRNMAELIYHWRALTGAHHQMHAALKYT